ncbi:hypothetical protein [Ehrlichia muris]|uniref:Uncharacterized protein n=1 Tax=Ehrlichia muris AS145 TaxID=1423892 RepID=V9R9X9_9RICK|nr:hypothetical protein [Ehrlichia muris]AHC39676.1 hypothetical protein EMUR_01175 [Ehrlichia muris AS145]
MLTQLRNSWQRLRIPSFVRALRQFDLHNTRNIQYPDCKSGRIAWLDFPRSPLVVNGQPTGFNALISSYNRKYKPPEDCDYRKILHKMIFSTFKKISNQNISPPLVDECVTLLNQASLYGASLRILNILTQDMQDRMSLDRTIVPTMNTYGTQIETLSESILTIHHTEQLILRDIETGNPISNISATIHFDMSSDNDAKVTYSNPKISLEIPQDLASRILPPMASLRMANMLVPLSNAFHRIQSLFTGIPFQKIKPYEIMRKSNALTIECKLPHYSCIPVTIPDIANQKEKDKQKQQSQYQTRSTFTPPHSSENKRKLTGNSNKDSQQQQNQPLSVSAKICEPKVQPQKNPKIESRSL